MEMNDFRFTNEMNARAFSLAPVHPVILSLIHRSILEHVWHRLERLQFSSPSVFNLCFIRGQNSAFP